MMSTEPYRRNRLPPDTPTAEQPQIESPASSDVGSRSSRSTITTVSSIRSSRFSSSSSSSWRNSRSSRLSWSSLSSISSESVREREREFYDYHLNRSVFCRLFSKSKVSINWISFSLSPPYTSRGRIIIPLEDYDRDSVVSCITEEGGEGEEPQEEPPSMPPSCGKKKDFLNFNYSAMDKDPSSLSASCAAIGSILYLIGGSSSRSRMPWLGSSSVYLLDATSSSPNPGPPMIYPRLAPHTAVAGGKLYVMGGSARWLENFASQWGEVFDPSRNCWSLLPSPPVDRSTFDAMVIQSTMITALWKERHLILLGSSRSDKMYSFDLNTQQWDIFRSFPSWTLPFAGPALVVDGVMFCWASGLLYGYDLQNKWIVCSTLANMGCIAPEYAKLEDFGFMPSLFHLGGDLLCMIWLWDGKLHQVTFHASILLNNHNDPYLETSVTSCFYQYVDPDYIFSTAVLM